MNRGFGFYFKKGWVLGGYAYRRLSIGKKIEFAFFALVCFLFSSIPFLSPIFMIALFNAAKMAAETHTIHIMKCFEGVANNNRYRELLICHIFQLLTIAVGVTLFFIPNIPYIIGGYLIIRDAQEIVMYVTIGLASLYAFIVSLIYFPCNYLACNTTNSSAGDILYNVVKAKKRNTWTTFVIMFFYSLLITIVLGVPAAGVYFINFYLGGYAIYGSLGCALGFVIFLLAFAAPLFLMLHTSLYCLYKDTVSNKRNLVVKPLNGDGLTYASIFPSEDDEINLLNDRLEKENKRV